MRTSCKIYPFLRAVRGNWRNAIFVRCGCDSCMEGRPSPCAGFLLAVDECGQIMLLSAETTPGPAKKWSRPSAAPHCPAVLLIPPFPNTSNGMPQTLPHVRSCSFVCKPNAAGIVDFCTKRRHCAVFGAPLEVMIL